jgi:transketolase
MAAGAAIAERFLVARFGEWMAHKIYTLVSDGSIQEEISQGIGRIAGYLGLGNLIMFYDSNDIQLSHEISQTTTENTEAKYKAWGWHVVTIDGNDTDQIRQALYEANDIADKPSLIIGKTIMAKGAVDDAGKNFERKTSTHGMPLTKAGGNILKTIEGLGGDPDNPFTVFPEVKKMYDEVLKKKREIVKKRRLKEITWGLENPEKAEKLKQFLSGLAPDIDLSKIELKPDNSTRGTSGTVLSYLAQHVDNMIVSSADLSNSDKTDGFLKHTTAFKKNDFSGAFLQAGVSELSMTAICNGIASHGGIHVACATFFVFSDYMKPAVRLAALMELPVKFIWSHDAFRVGEDGPTHQPIEQEAQIRLLEKVKNNSGRPSMLVLRPADGEETKVAWKMAMENSDTPTGLILSRQAIKDVPACCTTRADEALNLTKGAYIVKHTDGNPDIIFLANGSEVTTLLEGAALLEQRNGVKVRVVSVPSEGLFLQQPEEYRKSVLSYDLPIFGLTAGLPVNYMEIVGLKGKVLGLDHFGLSAPYMVLDEKFGFTAENVYVQSKAYLKAYRK